MSRRKQISPEIIEAAKKFDPVVFAQTVRGEFADFPDPRTNEKRILYPVWYLALIVLCGFFCGCNTIEEIAEYGKSLKSYGATRHSFQRNSEKYSGFSQIQIFD